jgi:hypothetical protein
MHTTAKRSGVRPLQKIRQLTPADFIAFHPSSSPYTMAFLIGWPKPLAITMAVTWIIVLALGGAPFCQAESLLAISNPAQNGLQLEGFATVAMFQATDNGKHPANTG